jgi:hypothetical protein
MLPGDSWSTSWCTVGACWSCSPKGKACSIQLRPAEQGWGHSDLARVDLISIPCADTVDDPHRFSKANSADARSESTLRATRLPHGQGTQSLEYAGQARSELLPAELTQRPRPRALIILALRSAGVMSITPRIVCNLSTTQVLPCKPSKRSTGLCPTIWYR